jgi:hypothetical protein
MPQDYYAPTLTKLGSVRELTLGAAPGFPDTCDLAAGSVVGADPCSGTPDPITGTPKP